MPKVLHINSNYLTSALHENLIDSLEKNKIKNTIYMPMKRETIDKILFESKHNLISPIVFRDIDKFIFTYKQYKIYKNLINQIKVREYDIVHAHTLFTDGNIAYLLNKKYGIPYVVTVRSNTDIDGFFKKRINLRNKGRNILENASKIIFLSNISQSILLDKYIRSKKLKNKIINKSQIIPNGIDDFYFENEGQPRSIGKGNKIKLLQIGKVIPRKNGLGSVRAALEYQERYGREVEITFVGKILDQSYLKKIKREGKNIVNIIENVSMERLRNIYETHDLFIMPSFTETFGLVYPEALSQGLPIIYTKGQGFDGEFQDGFVGYSVDPSESTQIADRIEKILSNYETMSKNSLVAYKKYNWNKLAKYYKSIYTLKL